MNIKADDIIKVKMFQDKAESGGGGTGTVDSVNSKEPDENGNVSLSMDDIPDGTNYKGVTQTEKNTWNAKESTSNKVTAFQATPDDTHYPSEKLTKDTLDKKQTVFTGICQEQYLTENDIVIDCVSATPRLTIATVKNGEAISASNPICFYTDGNGIATKHTKATAQFVEFTYTTGIWYFYFDSTGTLIASQNSWTDFSNIASVYRIYLNATLSGQSRCVVESMEMHKNDVSWTEHAHMHSGGTVWITGGDIVSNTSAISGTGVPTAPPNADGRNTVVSLSTIKNQDDNMPYTVTNSTDAVTKFNQDMGNLTAGSLTSSNSGLFKVRTNDSSGRLFFLPATRFPFPWDTVSNRPEYITALGVRTLVADNRWFVTYVYALQDPRNGEAIKVVPEITDFSTYVLAQASTWDNLKAVYPTLRDNEIRPLYKLTFYNDNSGGGAYSASCKYSALIRIDDIRTAKVVSGTGVSGSTLATSVTFAPAGNISSTNVQSAIEELDTEKLTGTDAGLGALIGGLGDATPNDTDFVATSLTSGGVAKKITWTAVKAFLKTYFDTLYGAGNMILASVQSVTGLKTFDKDKIAMKGTSTGVNTISVANTSATSYTNTIPAKDGTFAMTSDITGTNSGTNTGDETANRIATLINGTTAKTTPVSADSIIINDSEASNTGKKLTFANLSAFISTALATTFAPFSTAVVDCSTSKTLTNANCKGTKLTNKGQTTANIQITLPTITTNMEFVFVAETTQASNTWKITCPANSKFYLDGVAGTNAQSVIVTPAFGNYISFIALDNGTTVDLIATTGIGVFSQGA